MGGVQDAAGARLGALVREHRRAAGLTQRQLAQRSGLSVAAVRDLEQGRSRRPRRGSLDALARALGLDARQPAALEAAGDAARPASGGAPAGHGSGLWLAVLGPLTAWRDGLSVGLGPPGRLRWSGCWRCSPASWCAARRSSTCCGDSSRRPPRRSWCRRMSAGCAGSWTRQAAAGCWNRARRATGCAPGPVSWTRQRSRSWRGGPGRLRQRETRRRRAGCMRRRSGCGGGSPPRTCRCCAGIRR